MSFLLENCHGGLGSQDLEKRVILFRQYALCSRDPRNKCKRKFNVSHKSTLRKTVSKKSSLSIIVMAFVTEHNKFKACLSEEESDNVSMQQAGGSGDEESRNELSL